MSSTSAPFGLRPAFHPSGLDRAQALANGIASGYASNILKGQPVQYGTTANSITLGTIGIAATSGAIAGAFAGVEWTDTTGRRRVSNYWPANTAVQTGSVVAYFYSDANIVYEIQADATMAQTAIGNEYPFSNITAGSAVTGLSQCTLNAGGAVGNGVQGQLRVVDIAPYPGNDWGDLFPIVRVVISQSQFFGAFTAIA
jgi:hypothetical protein